MSDFWGKNVQNSISAGAPSPYGELYNSAPPLVELTALPWPPAAFNGPYF